MFDQAGSVIKRAQQWFAKNRECYVHLLVPVRLRPSLTFSVLLSTCYSLPAFALGMGELQVISSIGQPFKVEIPVIAQESEELLQSCIKGKLFNLDGTFIANTGIAIEQQARGKTIVASTRQAIAEPALTLQVSIECGQRLERSWQMLLDMPNPNSITSPSMSATPRALPIPSTDRKTRRQLARAARAAEKAAQKAAAENSKQDQPAETVSNAAKLAPAPALTASDNPPLASNTPSKPPTLKEKAASAKKSGERSVLKLSKASEADLAELDQLVLAMSGKLSSESLAKVEQQDANGSVSMPAVSAELAAAQELSAMQQKVRMLEAEANRLQQRSQEQDHLLQNNPTDKNAYQWLFGLALVLIAALLAIVWLLWRMQQLRQRGQENWSQLGADAMPAPIPVKPANVTTSAPTINPAQAGGKASAKAAAAAAAVIAPIVAPNASEMHENFFDDEDEDASAHHHPAPPSKPSKPASSMREASPPPKSAMIAPLDFEPSSSFSHHDLEMPTVDEVTDAMHEAEFWMSLGKPEKAAEVLELYGKSDHPTSPITWLYLFDLYRTLQDEEKYTQLRTQFQRRFNAIVPQWGEDVGATTQQHGLENQPALLEKITMLWGTHKIVPYLEDLIIDNREGMRTGFALPTYREILFLLDLAHNVERLEPIHALEFH